MDPVSGLSARLDVRRGAFRLDLALDVAGGEVVALLGPNGAGKTTALRALAGLVPLDGGGITLQGRPLDKVPVEKRPVGMVFQDYLLFPHLSVLENVAFGPRSRGVKAAQARKRAQELIARVGLTGYEKAKPGELSGGQAQRVALARALAVEPALLLLDEPLAALDAHTRLEIRAGLRGHLAAFGGVAVLVTHDALDAMVLADRLIVIEDGRIVQEGTPTEIAHRPRTDYVARLVGLNLHRGTADGVLVDVEGTRLSVAEPLHGPVFVAFAPSAVALYRERPDGSPRNLWKATVEGVERHGTSVRVHLTGPFAAAADITPAAVADLALRPGSTVWAAVKATETHAYPA
ncbi:ABC transporter ATP-binding protein [Actinocorallia sp. API 0066]|uniref:ABC transporter ATP-binding protein n=1 Tax=Actinocorallia sp. API 0066 TaxID=2896846 RepID=UPI001E45C587|nr:ABC transporter ATP-binding protein [Actinocorallia sp. API 0066]